jgi:hypothetical protein
MLVFFCILFTKEKVPIDKFLFLFSISLLKDGLSLSPNSITQLSYAIIYYVISSWTGGFINRLFSLLLKLNILGSVLLSFTG